MNKWDNQNNKETNLKLEKLPLIDKITYGPIKKYKVYGRFPWKMLVHVVLVMFVTFLIIWSVETTGGYSRSELLIFYRMFVDGSIEVNAVDFETTKYFYNLSEVTDFVNN